MASNGGAYDADDLERQALAAIEANGLVFVEEVCNYLPCCKSTFYNKGLDDLDTIKDALARNRVSKKLALRKKWEDSDNATLQMGLYKLLATPEELAALSMQQIDHTTKGKELPITIIEFVPSTHDSDNDQDKG